MSGSASSNSFGNTDRDRVLGAVDLVALIGEHIALRPKGREFVGLCPFHDDRTPSLAVVVHKGDAFYKCFACGAAGNAIDFAMEHLRMDFPSALRFLAHRAGITLAPPTRTGARRDASEEVDREALLAANLDAMRHWRTMLLSAKAGRSSNPAALAATRMLGERGISDESSEAWNLGVASDSWDDLSEYARARELDQRAFLAAGLLKSRKEGSGHYDAFRNRVIFPICDEGGRTIAFGARKINPEDEPKYLNSSESSIFSKSRTLYGLHLARRAIIDANEVLVTEGYTDVIACHQAGVRNAVATLGTALTREHARVLRRFCERVVLLFDGDEAGQKAADRAAEVFFAEPVDVVVCALPDGLDPDELLRTEGGLERFRAALASAIPVTDFLVNRLASDLEAATTGAGRNQRLHSFVARLVELGFGTTDALRRRAVLERIASVSRTRIFDLEALLAEALKRGRASASSSAAAASVAAGRTDIHPNRQADEEIDLQDPLPIPISIARAEADLLGLLVRHPQLGAERVDAGDGHHLPAAEAFAAGAFRVRAHALLAGELVPWLERGIESAGPSSAGAAHEPSFQTLLAEVALPKLRALASALYLAADKRTDGRLEIALPMLHQACADLEAATLRRAGSSREDVRRAAAPAPPAMSSSESSSDHADAGDTPSDDLASAERRLQTLRERGHDPSAFARFARAGRSPAGPSRGAGPAP